MTEKALARMNPDRLAEIAGAAQTAEALCKPIERDRLIQRLTALGMVMSPNRPPAEASMWVHELARLLSDIAGDVLCEAIDECQRAMKFLPTVAEIRAIAEPVMEQRRQRFHRLDAMRRYIESGQPMPKFGPPQKPLLDRRGEAMTEEETIELNAILDKIGACSRYRPDGSRYMVKERPAPQSSAKSIMPTREDYISWGVDPAVLDNIAAENAA